MISLAPFKQYLSDHTLLEVECVQMGLINAEGNDVLSFAEDLNNLKRGIENKSIKSIIIDEKLNFDFKISNKNIIKSKNPKILFYKLLNQFNKIKIHTAENIISKNARIAESVDFIGNGIVIEENVIIEPSVTIFDGTVINKNSIIRSGARVGAEQLEIKHDENDKIFTITHGGRCIIDEGVEIGYNTVIDRGLFSNLSTKVSKNTKIGSHVLIGHGSTIGENNKIMSGVIIGGSTKIGNNNWIGANSVISNQLSIKNNTHISMGSVLFENLDNNFSYINNRILKDRKRFIK